MSENKFLEKFRSKPETELERIINDKKSFTEQARIAAIEILKERNGETEFTKGAEKEVVVSQERKEAIEQKLSEEKKKDSFLTDDLDAPELHSKRVITMFAAIFSTIFGAVLMMHNFKAVGNIKARNQVLVFGILYTVASILIINSLNIRTNLAVILNLGGAIVLTELFWNKQLGKNIRYRKRSWVKPAIISVIITIPFLLAIIYG
tara:strand:+ start:4485 stop:5102 length:618 start_codon:yes stop_codon:yes gene_type:complete